MRVRVRRRDGTTFPAKLDLSRPAAQRRRRLHRRTARGRRDRRARDRSHADRATRCGAHGRVLVVAHARAAVAAECVRHVARRPRARSAGGQARQGRRGAEAQPRSTDAAHQRPQRRRQGLVGGQRDPPRAFRSRRPGRTRPRLLAVARYGEATCVSPPHRARSGAHRRRSRAAVTSPEPFARKRDQQHTERRQRRPASARRGRRIASSKSKMQAPRCRPRMRPIYLRRCGERRPAQRSARVSASAWLSRIESPFGTAARWRRPTACRALVSC